jgi:hypothetical protein
LAQELTLRLRNLALPARGGVASVSQKDVILKEVKVPLFSTPFVSVHSAGVAIYFLFAKSLTA